MCTSSESECEDLTSAIKDRQRITRLFDSDSRSSVENEIDGQYPTSLESSDMLTLFPSQANQNLFLLLTNTCSKDEKLSIMKNISKLRYDFPQNWNFLKILQESLYESDDEVFNVCLEIHENLMRSSWEMLKDTFINLLEALYVHYFSIRIVESVKEHSFKNMFKIYNLVLSTLDKVVIHAAKLGNSRLENIIVNFIDLVFITTEMQEYWNPLNVIACLDPKANWCKILLHKANTRKILLKCMKKNSHFLRSIFSTISEWMYNPFVPKVKTICPTTVKYVTFLTSICCCSYLSQFSEFYLVFPIVISRTEIFTLKSFITFLTFFLKCRSKTPLIITERIIECVVSLLKFQPTDSLVSRVQLITAELNLRYRRNLFIIMEKILDDDVLIHRIFNYIVNIEINKSDGEMYNTNNPSNNLINQYLIYLIINVLEKTNSDHITVNAVKMGIKILEHHNFYILFGVHDNKTMKHFIKLLLFKIVYSSPSNLLSENKDYSNQSEIIVCRLASTPLGFYYLSKSVCHQKPSTEHWSKNQKSWLWAQNRKFINFVVTSDHELIIDCVYQNFNTYISKNLSKLIENKLTADSEFIEKISLVINVLNYKPEGIRQIFSLEAQNEDNLYQFIRKFGLSVPENGNLQFVALSLLWQIIKNDMNVRLFTLRSMNYENGLTSILQGPTKENEKKSQCLELMEKILMNWFNPCSNIGRNITLLSSDTQSNLQTFLKKTKNGPFDTQWIKFAYKAFKDSLGNEMDPSVIIEIIEKIANVLNEALKINKQLISIVCMDNSTSHEVYSDVEKVIIATQHGILKKDQNHVENLVTVIKSVQTFIAHRYPTHTLVSDFDCILATLFFICDGVIEKCLQMVTCCLSLPVCVFIWPQTFPDSSNRRYLFGHILEWLLYQEIPKLYFALLNHGISWWIICQNLLKNCFWGTLSWPEICQWFCMTMIYPAENLLYYFTSIAHRNENKILEITNISNLHEQIRVMFCNRHLQDHILYMDHLARKYNKYINSLLSE